jgi:hypothetical protein
MSGHCPVSLRELLTLFRDKGILYCHWKSNEHLKEGIEGKTDLDLLVDRRAEAAVQGILSQQGFTRFLPTSVRRYPAIEDYLGFDAGSGRMLHLHIHWQLTVGERFLKGYQLPWEMLVLSTREFSKEYGIYTANANVELLLLIVRMALKIRARDCLRVLSGQRYWKGSALRELTWLRQRIDIPATEHLLQELLGKRPAALALRVAGGSTGIGILLRFRRSIRQMRKMTRRHSAVGACLRRWYLELLRDAGILNERILHLPIPSRRSCPSGGCVIAVIGCDGSGKSTVTRQLVAWLRQKIDVVPLYFGSGTGRSSLLRFPMAALNRAVSGPRKRDSVPKRVEWHRQSGWKIASPASVRSAVKSCARIPWSLALAREKLKKLRRARIARARGMLVICDRYPQNQFPGFNDGPLLADWQTHRLRLLRLLSAWERRAYEWAELYPPDLVIKLQVAPEVALQRKPDTGVAQVQRRVKAIAALEYGAPAKTVVIDANRSLDEVLIDVKRAVWGRL